MLFWHEEVICELFFFLNNNLQYVCVCLECACMGACFAYEKGWRSQKGLMEGDHGMIQRAIWGCLFLFVVGDPFTLAVSDIIVFRWPFIFSGQKAARLLPHYNSKHKTPTYSRSCSTTLAMPVADLTSTNQANEHKVLSSPRGFHKLCLRRCLANSYYLCHIIAPKGC